MAGAQATFGDDVRPDATRAAGVRLRVLRQRWPRRAAATHCALAFVVGLRLGSGNQALLALNAIAVRDPVLAAGVASKPRGNPGDWAIRAFDGAGVTNDLGWRPICQRAPVTHCRGADDVHCNQIGKLELKKYR